MKVDEVNEDRRSTMKKNERKKEKIVFFFGIREQAKTTFGTTDITKATHGSVFRRQNHQNRHCVEQTVIRCMVLEPRSERTIRIQIQIQI